MQTLYLIRGVPGSGKSTLAAELKFCGVVDAVFEADDAFLTNNGYVFDPSGLQWAHHCCQQNTKYCLADGYSVAVSNTSTTEKEVETYQKIAKDFGVRFVSLIVENRQGTTNKHNVPEEKIQQMRNRFSIKL
jgi:predicted kinase